VMYRDFVEHDSAYEQLANAYLAKENKAAATKALIDYSNAGGRSPETLKKLAKATNQVCALVADGTEAHLGTGFLIKTNRVLTAFHVLPEDDAKIVCLFNNITFDGSSVRSQEMLRVAVKNIERKSPKPPDDAAVTKEHLDFAVLELQANAGADPRGFVELGPKRIDLDKEAFVVGHPGSGLQVVFSAGKITKEFMDATDLVFFHNASADHGESGAPVFNANFDVIGMHRAPGKEKNENEAVSTSVIHRVIDGPRPSIRLSQE